MPLTFAVADRPKSSRQDYASESERLISGSPCTGNRTPRPQSVHSLTSIRVNGTSASVVAKKRPSSATSASLAAYLFAGYHPGRNSVQSYTSTNLAAPRNSLSGPSSQLLSVKFAGASAALAAALRGADANRRGSLLHGLSQLYKDEETFAEALSQKLTTPWIEQVFQKRECAKFIATSKDENRCGCGRNRLHHSVIALNPPLMPSVVLDSTTDRPPLNESQSQNELQMPSSSAAGANNINNNSNKDNNRWTIGRHTMVENTDAFGTIEFQGGPHPHKAQYVRLGFDSDPADIMYLFEKIWQIEPPKLVITVHGGIANFELQPKLARIFRKGLLKAAKTTGAWIITSGIDAGAVRHVAAALESGGAYPRSRSRIVTIGIAPWGLLKKRDDFIGKDVTLSYHPHGFSPKGRFAVLNNRHSYFLLVDNGTIGRYGADIILRKRLEEYISRKQTIDSVTGTNRVPVVCVVLEGGTCTVRSVLDYVTNIPPVPVVVCDGSGRAADLLAFAHHYAKDDGSLPEGVKPQLLNLVKTVFGYNNESAEKVILELMLCVKKRHLITVFRLGEDQQKDVDHAILTALLKGQNLSSPDQLALALAWDRVDIARSDIFVLGVEWPPEALNNAMMEALVNDRVDFVRLLLENGVSMEKFLNVERLEELYNTDRGPPNTLYYIVRDVVKVGDGYRYCLPDLGLAVQKLMGSAYQSTYLTREFRIKYHAKKELRQLKRGIPGNQSGAKVLGSGTTKEVTFQDVDKTEDVDSTSTLIDADPDFEYPFNELLVWAVLTKRQEMARCMWQHGAESTAKALIACRLYKCLAREAAEDYLEVEICDELRKYAEEFRKLSLELLEHCYQQDDDQTLQLLTYELKNWGCHTCLSLAVIANNKEFLAHPCCQILLADLWHGGLRIRSQSNLKVIIGLLFPPSILLLEFKSREELMQQPQTAAEHAEDVSLSTNSSESDDGGSISSAQSDSEHDAHIDEALRFFRRAQVRDKSPAAGADDAEAGARARKPSFTGSAVSNSSVKNLASIFTTGRSKKRKISRRASRQASAMVDANGRPELARSISQEQNKNNIKVHAPTSPPPQSLALRHYDPYMTLPRTKTMQQKKSLLESVRPVKSFYGLETGGLGLEGSQERHGSSLPDRVYPGPPVHHTWMGGSNTRHAQRALRLRRKFYEFYVAPITTFWAWTFSFVVFMTCFTYVLLVETPPIPTWIEWYLLAYVSAFGLEHVRKLLMSEPPRLSQKVKVFFNRYWNYLTTAAVVTFLIGFAFRLVIATHESTGRVLLACNSVLWFIKILDFMSVHPKLGPYITMAAKMVINMSYIVLLLLVTLMAFGVARQSITYPEEKWSWVLVRNIFYKPYFMLYGEVYAGEIDTCNDEGFNCRPGIWIPPILMTIFLLVANILLINMLIAIFNNIFNSINSKSQQVWLFQRYEQVMEYESTPFLPPPFTPICYIYMLAKFLRVCINGDRLRKNRLSHAKYGIFDFALKLFLEDDQVKKLHDFEEDCMDDLYRNKEYEKNTSTDERIHRTAERVEFQTIKLNDLVAREALLRGTVREIENKLESIERNQDEILSCLRQLVSNSSDSGAMAVSTSVSPEAERKSRTLRLSSKAKTSCPSNIGAQVVEDVEQRSALTRAELMDHRQRPGPSDERRASSAQRQRQKQQQQQQQQQKRKDSTEFYVSSDGNTSEVSDFVSSPRRRQRSKSTARPPADDGRAGSIATNRDDRSTSEARIASLSKDSSEVSSPTSSRRDRPRYFRSATEYGPAAGGKWKIKQRRPRRNDEYTSITDYIAVNNSAGRKSQDSPGGCEVVNEEDDTLVGSTSSFGQMDENAGPPHRRAKASYVTKQNEMLKQYEETSSRITGGLIEGRIRRESQNVNAANEDEMREMGMDDLDVKDYLQCLDRQAALKSAAESSLGSSFESLSSAARAEEPKSMEAVITDAVVDDLATVSQPSSPIVRKKD